MRQSTSQRVARGLVVAFGGWLFVVGPAPAQTVIAASVAGVTLSAGSRDGVRMGMTGKLCTTESAGGRSVELCPAAFQVTSVSERQASAAVTRGDAAEVAAGFRALFDAPLVPPEAPSGGGSPQPARAPAADAELLFWSSVKDSSDPEELRLFLSKFPRGTFAELARARLQKLGGAPSPAGWTEPQSGVVFRRIPAGAFTLGCTAGDSECDDDEKPAHPVTISRPFYLAETETTVGQHRRFTGATGRAAPSSPSFSQTDEHPVVNVSWEDAKAFCDWTGGRLPTEAEWEYAARGGQSGWRYPWGNTISHDNANYGKETCCGGLAEGRDRWVETAPVRSFAANGYGLHDMAGNVWEWVADGYEASYYASSPATDPAGPATASGRVLRGGSWSSVPGRLRVSFRGGLSPGVRVGSVGFRCARTGIP